MILSYAQAFNVKIDEHLVKICRKTEKTRTKTLNNSQNSIIFALHNKPKGLQLYYKETPTQVLFLIYMKVQ